MLITGHVKNVVVKKLFITTAYQQKRQRASKGLRHIRHMSEEVFEYMKDMEIEKWSLAFDGGYRYGYATTNMAEVFNDIMKGARFLSVTTIVELTFYRVNKWFVKKREIARERLASNHPYTVYVERKTEANRRKARYHSVEPFDITNGKYEVTTGKGERIEPKGGKCYTVNFSNRTYTCKKIRFSTILVHTC